MIILRLFVLLIFLTSFSSHGALYNAKEHLSFWRENYTELLSKDDVLVEEVHLIFNTISRVAGSRPGKSARLLIIKETPYGFNLPISLPDGGIVISKVIIDRLYESGSDFDAKIAFVLGHELAHIYSEDFWHSEFFRLLVNYQENDRPLKQTDDDYRIFLDNRRELVKKEISADEHGLLYMMLAGFDPTVIVDSRQYQSFFDEWNAKISGISEGNFEPLVPHLDRRLAVEARLNLVLSQSSLYQTGLLYFIAEDYSRAIALFENYARIFPSREVYHNLALSYHFAAISHYTPEKFVTRSVPIKFSYVIDPVERLFSYTRRNIENPAKNQYSNLLERAINFYELSIQSDDNYLPAYINLATAYIGKGAYYKAIGLLLEASEVYTDPGLLNNLAIAYELIGDRHNAAKNYKLAVNEFSNLDAIYNFGRLSFLDGDQEEANRYWQRYLKTDRQSHFASLLEDVLELEFSSLATFEHREKLDDIEVNLMLDLMPRDWQVALDETLDQNAFTMRYMRFQNGVNVVGERNRVKLLSATSDYRGASGLGIRVDDSKARVVKAYGYPSKTINTPIGEILSYRNQGISFLFKGDKVNSWLLF